MDIFPWSDKLLGTDIWRSKLLLLRCIWELLVSKVDTDLSKDIWLGKPLPWELGLFIMALKPPLLDGLEVGGGGPPLGNPGLRPPWPPPPPNPGSRPKSKDEVLPIRLDSLDVLELLDNPPPPPPGPPPTPMPPPPGPLFELLKLWLLKPKPFC